MSNTSYDSESAKLLRELTAGLPVTYDGVAGWRCQHMLRDGQCAMDDKHRGRHTTVAFYCDGCGKMRRGRPVQEDQDVAICFMCVREDKIVRALGEYPYDA